MAGNDFGTIMDEFHQSIGLTPKIAPVKQDTKLFLCSGVSKPQGCVKFALIQYDNEEKQTGQQILHSLSRDLTSAEKKYGSLELEALALAFGMEHCYCAFSADKEKLPNTKNFYVKVAHKSLYQLLSRKKYKSDNKVLNKLFSPDFIPFEKCIYFRT